MLPVIVFFVNGIFLFITLFLAWRMYRAADTYNKNQGDNPVQEKQKWKILRSIVILLIVGLLAAIFNLVITGLIPSV